MKALCMSIRSKMKKRPLITTCLLLLNILLSFTSIVNAEQATTKKMPVKQERRMFSSPILQDVYDQGYPGRGGNRLIVNVDDIIGKYISIGMSLSEVNDVITKNGLVMVKTLELNLPNPDGLTDKDYRAQYLFKGANLLSGDWRTITLYIDLTFSEQHRLIKMRAATVSDGM